MALSGITLVTGGAGFIGSHIAAALANGGARVRIVDDLSTGSLTNLEAISDDDLSTGSLTNLEAISDDVDFIQASIADEDRARAALEDVELIFHQAAIPSVPRSVEQPAETHVACTDGTFALLLAARDRKVRRVVYAASSSAYGDRPELPKREDMEPDPVSPYAAAKLAGEYYCRAFTHSYGLETVCLRYFNVYGPRQDPSSPYSGVISRFVSALLSDERPVIYGDGEQSRDFTYVSDVVDANLRAAESTSAAGRVINIGAGMRVTVNELLDHLKQLTGRSDVTAEYLAPRKGDVRDTLADIFLARALLDYEPHIDLETGLRLTIDWWKSSHLSGSRLGADH